MLAFYGDMSMSIFRGKSIQTCVPARNITTKALAQLVDMLEEALGGACGGCQNYLITFFVWLCLPKASLPPIFCPS
jgi:hypothetical protein